MNERESNRDDAASDWRRQRRTGMLAIAVASVLAVGLWLAIRFLAPPIAGMETLAARMVFALKCLCLATLFCLVTGIEAVAHERLRSAAFDPLAGFETKRLRINLRYLQNTLEQLIVFAVGLFGLAAYCADGNAMRVVEATTATWIISRWAFWLGYHRSAAMRGLGAPSMALSLIVLLYVAARIGGEVAGTAGAVGIIVAFLAFEALLFRATRAKAPSA
jgi:hypothetical protein